MGLLSLFKSCRVYFCLNIKTIRLILKYRPLALICKITYFKDNFKVPTFNRSNRSCINSFVYKYFSSKRGINASGRYQTYISSNSLYLLLNTVIRYLGLHAPKTNFPLLFLKLPLRIQKAKGGRTRYDCRVWLFGLMYPSESDERIESRTSAFETLHTPG